MEPELTDRERQILTLMLEGLQHKEIGDRLDISTRTVKFHACNILMKYQVATRGELLRKLRKDIVSTREPWALLSSEEQKVCILTGKNASVKDICTELGITISRHRVAIYSANRVLGVSGRAGMAAYLAKRGLI